ncbi:helix-turn-helix domain-containing protein [Rurimicrobium arvi]|uniref:Helix-turn-helix domain-containing protein n=1 Tax=Rurimicrobium arvi TaxID=2049916 RepID=A0ABP8N0N2_9BACT
MEVICLEDAAFYALIDKVVKRLTDGKPKTEKWVSGQEAMQMLRITSKATLQKFRDEGKIRFSQPEKKIILYDTDSIQEFLNKNAREVF